MNWQDIAERAFWTAAQAFLAGFGGLATVTDTTALKSALLAGGMAAAAALLSFVKNIVRQKVAAQGA